MGSFFFFHMYFPWSGLFVCGGKRETEEASVAVVRCGVGAGKVSR